MHDNVNSDNNKIEYSKDPVRKKKHREQHRRNINWTLKIEKLKAKNDNEPSIEDKLKLKSLNTNIQFDEADMSEVDAIFWKCKLCQKLFDYEGRFYTHFTSPMRRMADIIVH